MYSQLALYFAAFLGIQSLNIQRSYAANAKRVGYILDNSALLGFLIFSDDLDRVRTGNSRPT
jgi:hypothetical protein